MYLQSKTLSVVAKIFSLPPIVAGAFLIYKHPESLYWGVFTLTIGIIIFGFRYGLYINKTYIKRSIGFYKFIIWSKSTEMEEFDSIYLGMIKSISMNETASGTPNFDIVFAYKHPEKYLSGDSSSKAGVDLNAFIFNRNYDRKNFEFFSENIITEISNLTGLPIKFSEEVEEDFG
jgi:hypothetical protein